MALNQPIADHDYTETTVQYADFMDVWTDNALDVPMIQRRKGQRRVTSGGRYAMQFVQH